VAGHLLSLHNIRYLLRLMERMREAIDQGTIEQETISILEGYFGNKSDFPNWIRLGLELAEFEH